MKQHLINMVLRIKDVIDDSWNPETYFETRTLSESGSLHIRYVLGNLYASGYSESTQTFFEIFKDHSTWQVWVWQVDTVKDHSRNSFNTPYYNYDKLIEYIEKTF